MSAAGLLLLALAQSPCDAGPALDHPDAAAAAAYFEVAQDELARGSWEAARFSLREAARNAPRDPRIRAAWASVCQGPPKDAFRAGLERMRKGDCRGAISDFAAARAKEPDPAAALLQGICLSELGRDEEAKAALEDARRAPELADPAQLHLGLIAAHEGRARDADALLHPLASSADPSVSAAARQAMRDLSEDGKLVLTAGVETLADSNPYVLPGLPGAPEAAFGAFGSAVLRPFGPSGPYARAYGLYRDLVRTAVFDAGSFGGAAGWRLGSGATFARAELGYDTMNLGGVLSLSGPRAELSGAIGGRAGVLLGSYQLRDEQVDPLANAWATLTGYSGLTHEVTAWAQRPLGEGIFAALGYRAFRATTADPALAYFEHGPRAELQLRPWSSGRLRLEASYLWRPFDSGLRSDGVLEGGAEASVEVSDALELQLTGLAQLATSNDPAFQYTRFVFGVGVSFTGAPL